MVVELVRRLEVLGQRSAVLLRGYKALGGQSDEADLLRCELGSNAVIEADPDRIAAAARVLDREAQDATGSPGADVTAFVLDDGFQHRQVARDLDLVLIDATRPWGYGRLLPRGLLRESPANLRRADAVIVTRADQVSPAELGQLDRRIQDLTGRTPLGHAAHRWTAWRDHADNRVPLDILAALPVFAVTGIGNSAAFEMSLRDHVGTLLEHRALPDHHCYTVPQLDELVRTARDSGAQALVTTDKDWVKWRHLNSAEAWPLAVYRPQLEIHWLDGAERLNDLLKQTLSRTQTPRPEAPPHD